MINTSPSFSSPSNSQSFSAPSSSPNAPSWISADQSHQLSMSQGLLDSQFSAEHNAAGFQPMFTTPFGAPFQSHGVMPNLPTGHVQPGMYATHDLNTFWKPDPSTHMIKMEPGADIFAPQPAPDFASYPGSQPMMSSMSLPTYATHAPERRFNFSDAESLCSVASPSSNSEASIRHGSAKRVAKRKLQADVSLDSPSAVGTPDAADASKSSKKSTKLPAQRRPPPSASHVTESGKPFPVIDTSAKHSSLFVPPDTSGLTKREARLVKNRAAAFLSRQRKREQFEEMEVKCKGISMLVWRMWEAIAGPDADLDLIDSTPLAAVLANEEPMARLCLEEVISKKGASIAPTADEAEGTPAPEAPAMCRSATGPVTSTQKVTETSSAELERARADLSASLQRERDLLAQLDALRANLVHTQNTMVANAMPVANFQDVNMSQAGLSAAMGIESLPFKAVQGAELPLFVPESPMSKFTMGGSTEGHAMLDAAHNGFDLSKTPTLAMFSETALRNRSAQQFGSDKVTGMGMGLGLDYRFPCASAPSSPSTASSSSMESMQSRKNSISSSASGKAPSTLAMCLVLAGMSLMGVGPAAHELPNEPRIVAPRKDVRATRRARRALANATPALARENAGQPSSHLSNDDLLMEMGLDSASLSDADDDHSDMRQAAASTFQSGSASTVSCA